MDNELLDRLMWISITGLLLAGVIFIGIYFFQGSKENALLFAALFCNVLAGLFNIIRGFHKK